MAKIITPAEALSRMQSLCARAEHCTGEIDARLQRMGLPEDKRKDIIVNLRDNRFIDDRRYAMAFAGDKARFARWGERKIAMALRLKHIDTDLIRDAIEEVGSDIFAEGAFLSARSKAASMDRPLSYSDKAKIYAFLLTRGFDSLHIRQAIARLANPDK